MIWVLLLIPTIIILLQFVLHPFIYKISSNYLFSFLISIFFIAYFLVFRYIPDVEYLINNIVDSQTSETYQYSFYWSKTLLLDMCPLLACLIPLSLIFDKTKNFAKCLAPIGLIGSIITIYGGLFFDQDFKDVSWDTLYKYIFFGINNDDTTNRIYFMMHLMLLVISVHTLLNAKQYTKWSIFSSIIFYIFYITYALLLSRLLDIKNNVTGLVEYDWISEYGEYHAVYNFMPMSFPGIVIFWYFMAALGNLLICYIKNYLTTDLFKITRYNKKFYENIKNQKIVDFFNLIDNKISLKIFKKQQSYI